VMWEPYRLPSLARCLNVSYAGGDFDDWLLLIVSTFGTVRCGPPGGNWRSRRRR